MRYSERGPRARAQDVCLPLFRDAVSLSYVRNVILLLRHLLTQFLITVQSESLYPVQVNFYPEILSNLTGKKAQDSIDLA